MGFDCMALYDLGHFVIKRCRANVLRATSGILRFEIIRRTFERNNLDNGKRICIVVSQGNAGVFGTKDEFLNDNEIVYFKHCLQSRFELVFCLHDLDAD